MKILNKKHCGVRGPREGRYAKMYREPVETGMRYMVTMYMLIKG
jgi:hypothetical protein